MDNFQFYQLHTRINLIKLTSNHRQTPWNIAWLCFDMQWFVILPQYLSITLFYVSGEFGVWLLNINSIPWYYMPRMQFYAGNPRNSMLTFTYILFLSQYAQESQNNALWEILYYNTCSSSVFTCGCMFSDALLCRSHRQKRRSTTRSWRLKRRSYSLLVYFYLRTNLRTMELLYCHSNL